MKEGYLESFDKAKIYYYEWNEVEKPIGIVQIMHGLAEHAKRYEGFAKALNKAGYIVFADDHRAHGRTVGKADKVGIYDGIDVFDDTVQDEMFISQMLVDKYKLPLYVFGHSYGSFLCQAYIGRCNLYKKAILCGSALMTKRIDVPMGKMVAKITAKRKGNDAPANMIVKMSFGSYEKKLKSGSWLNTDENEVKKYYADPFCGKTCSAKFYVDFFSAFSRIYKKDYVANIDKNKPLLLIAGQDDPVGSCGKSMKKLCNFYNKLDIKNVTLKLYEGARHEILNEPIKEKVSEDIISFLKK